MESGVRFVWLSVGLGLFALVGYLTVRSWDVEFLTYIVGETLQRKLDPALDQAEVRGRMEVASARAERTPAGRDRFREALLGASAVLEKVQVVGVEECERVLGMLEGAADVR